MAHHRLVLPARDAKCGVPFQASVAASPPRNSRRRRGKKIKIKTIEQTTNTNVHETMLSVDALLHVCVCERVQTPAHTHGTRLQTNTHTRTRALAYTGPAHLCRTPPPVFAVFCLGPFAVRLWYCWGGLELSVGCEERVGQTDGEEE